MHNIINKIFQYNYFPVKWKVSKITPVFKDGNKADIHNYRPVALLSNLSKVFEIVVHKRIYPVISQYISENQHGFISGRSTTTNLVQISQYIATAMDQKQQVDVIYTDFSKAFDSIDHSILLGKLDSFGFDINLLMLFKNYLENRSFYVSYNNFCSQLSTAPSGVPQGSILGPLLFYFIYKRFVAKNSVSGTSLCRWHKNSFGNSQYLRLHKSSRLCWLYKFVV